MAGRPTYRIGIDIGGTFTDIVTARNDGLVESRKVPTTPDDYSRGIAVALETWLKDVGARPDQVTGIVHATTVATNAILEFKGARTGLLTTAGFRDVLELRRLRIPVLYDLQYSKPPPLVDRSLRLEVRERMGPDGTAKQALVEADVVAAAELCRDARVEAVAVSFLHAYANPAHEIAAELILRRELGPKVFLCRGSEILPEIREYERTSTAVVNAYIGPIVERYTAALQVRLAAIGIVAPVEMMHSGGGIMRLASAVKRAASLVESGPAAGVIACARLAREVQAENVLSFDMGGTTAKAALVERGEPARTAEYEVGAGINLSSKLVKGGGYPIKMPFVDVSEIGAGGGSLIAVDRHGHVSVGPRSAGAWPGPVCYGLGGRQATLTDTFVTLGYINDTALAGGSLPIDAEAARAALADQVAAALNLGLADTARGILKLAVTTMTRAVKAVSTYRGRDPRAATLVAFGGNGPVVAADVAATLGIRRVLVPPSAGVFSALGLLRSDVEQEFVSPVFLSQEKARDGQVQICFAALKEASQRAFLAEGYNLAAAEIRFGGDLRYHGQAYELTVWGSDAWDFQAFAEAFHREHEATYGHRSTTDPVQFVNMRLALRVATPTATLRFADNASIARRDRNIIFESGTVRTPVIGREDLDERLRNGPFVVEEYDCTCIVPPGSAARRDEAGAIEILPRAA